MPYVPHQNPNASHDPLFALFSDIFPTQSSNKLPLFLRFFLELHNKSFLTFFCLSYRKNEKEIIIEMNKRE